MLRLAKLATSSAALVLTAVALVASAPAGAGADSPSGTQKCGKHIVNGSGWYRLKATNTSCQSARKLADHFVFKAGGVDDRFHDWVCAKAQVGDEVWKVHCAREKDSTNQEADFLFGA
jgi:hypothetical protein